MSMLAERKQKQKHKWLLTGSLNRKNEWSADSNKLGQKLLERMGWKEGKGLGRNEDGLKEHVKLAYKCDNKGIGFKDDVEWSAQQDNFKALLKKMNNLQDDLSNKLEDVKSLEEKSQSSRVRVHYKKFTSGKDLSKYSEKDLANIFGRKTLNSSNEEDKNDATVDKSRTESTITNGVITIQGGSMVDYFKKKTLNIAVSDIKDDENFEGGGITYGVGDKKMKKDKKPKNNAKSFVSYVNDECADEEVVCENEQPTKKRKGVLGEMESATPKKARIDEVVQKTKKSKKNKSQDLDVGISNPAFEPLGNKIVIEKHSLGTIVENVMENDLNETQIPEDKGNCKKKKKKSKDCYKEQNESFDTTPYINNTLDEKEESTQKAKKKKKSKGLDNPTLKLDDSRLGENENAESVLSEDFEVKRKKKKKSSKGVDNPVLQLNDSDISNTLAENDEVKEDSEVKHKQKIKSSKGVDNPILQLNDSDKANMLAENDEVKENSEVKRKKKKNPSKGVDNPVLQLNDSDISNTLVENVEVKENSEVKRKKKKNLSKGVDNPVLRLNDSDIWNTLAENDEVNENSEVKHKKKKKSKGIDNPGLNLDDSNNSHTNEEKSCQKSLQNGIENLALENSDFDIMLNVTDEPIKPTAKVDKHTSKHRAKSVRFSKANQEFIFLERSPDDIIKRNELYDINTKVIEAGLRGLKQTNAEHDFDIKSVDKLDFYNHGTSKKKKYQGVDNQAYDVRAQKVEESVNMITKTIDHYQAEVENGINESKDKNHGPKIEVVGELICSDGENEEHKDGVKLRFKYANFNNVVPLWAKKNDAQTTLPKKSYKHLIQGDIIVGFKNSNLHKIKGYGLEMKKKI